MPGAVTDSGSGVLSALERAAAFTERGDADKSRRQLALAAAQARASEGKVDPGLAASALLLHSHAQLEAGNWPKQGPGLDAQLKEGLELARGLPKRNRQLEGQLLHAWSRAIFARPGARSNEDIDAAIEARHRSATLVVDATVEELRWRPLKVREAANRASADEHGLAESPVSFEKLLSQLPSWLKHAGDKITESASTLETLFEAWATPCTNTDSGEVESMMSAAEFLTSLADALERVVEEDKAHRVAGSCGAPCEGVEGFSDTESALVQLIARDGAGDWEGKARELAAGGKAEGIHSGRDVAAMWGRIAPRVKKVTDADQEMSCGHSCSTCPTRDDCQVHGALRDIEDL